MIMARFDVILVDLYSSPSIILRMKYEPNKKSFIGQFFTEHLKISQTELPIGLQVIAFRPFVPGLDEHNSVFAGDIAHPIKGPPQVASEQFGC